MPGPVILRTFPASDKAFARAADQSLAAAEPTAFESDLVEVVGRALVRAGYPLAVVRRREPLADVTNGGETVLYVYRDGRPGRSSARRDRWYAAAGAARETMEATVATLRHSQDLIEASMQRPARHRRRLANAANVPAEPPSEAKGAAGHDEPAAQT